MTEQELTPENVGELLGLASATEPDTATDDTATDSTDTTTEAKPEAKLDADQGELARRYGLSPEDVQRVRGETWGERCEDAERLAGLVGEPTIRDRARRHLSEMTAEQILLNPSQSKLERDEALVRMLHPEEAE